MVGLLIGNCEALLRREYTQREQAASDTEWFKKPGLYAASNFDNCRKRVLVLLDDAHVCHVAAIWSVARLL